jgi:hypothetical protein
MALASSSFLGFGSDWRGKRKSQSSLPSLSAPNNSKEGSLLDSKAVEGWGSPFKVEVVQTSLEHALFEVGGRGEGRWPFCILTRRLDSRYERWSGSVKNAARAAASKTVVLLLFLDEKKDAQASSSFRFSTDTGEGWKRQWGHQGALEHLHRSSFLQQERKKE